MATDRKQYRVTFIICHDDVSLGLTPAQGFGPTRGSLAFAGEQRLIHLGFEHFVQQHFQRIVLAEHTQQFLFCEVNRIMILFRADHNLSFVRDFRLLHQTTYYKSAFLQNSQDTIAHC